MGARVSTVLLNSSFSKATQSTAHFDSHDQKRNRLEEIQAEYVKFYCISVIQRALVAAAFPGLDITPARF
jgi:hypothetical protein